MKKIFQFGPIVRITFGVVSLILTLVLVADSLLDILPSEHKNQLEVRQKISNVVAYQVAVLVDADNLHDLRAMVDQLPASIPEIRSLGVRAGNRQLVAASRQHELLWTPFADNISSMTHAVVPVTIKQAQWGEVELVFVDPQPHGMLLGWLRRPSILIVLLLTTLGFIGVYFYMRRALYYLNPSNAVPQRVKQAFDTLTEAVLITDPKGQILLANGVFQEMNGDNSEQLEGKSIADIQWLVAGLTTAGEETVYPWVSVLSSKQTVQGKSLKVTLPDGRVHELMMNCSAIDDGTGVARGCLISFDDVTQLSEVNASLKSALQDLEFSKNKIQEQNKELQKSAFYDHLTGCLNRRAFFTQAEAMYQNATESTQDIVCIMVDIDHFKRFNDQYGHSVGDLVIQQVATTLGRSLRNEDVLCRYGGEEFCILLGGGLPKKNGLDVAERMRVRIEKECGPGIRSIEGLRITVSMGIAALREHDPLPSLQQLIDQADQGLYVAKEAGRNRVGGVDGTIFSGTEEVLS